MATPEINRLSTQTDSELKEFHTLTFMQGGGTQAQSERLQQTLNSSPLLAKNINSATNSGAVERLFFQTALRYNQGRLKK
ncbi:hypothetical protein [Neisseria sp. CCUG12390]|uniref:hypothetical protein n=1 Tax=Neisseria sp. CCUG12390 TaxID=3392035 RepID=UPI003A0FDAE3